MSVFTDKAGRDWRLSIDAPRALAVRQRVDPEFLKNDFADGGVNTFQRLQQDPVVLCGVLFVLCESQIKERSVTEESFYMEVIGDVIDNATEALLGAIVNFTPMRTRGILQTFANQEAMARQAIEEALQRVSDPQMAAKIKASITAEIDSRMAALQTRLSSATGLPAPSESLPTG